MFFYSNFCDNCKDVITIITNKNLRDAFCFVCVDQAKYKLPACITHVPSIITRNKEVLKDAYVIGYLEKLMSYQSKQIDDISPISMTQKAYSSSYTLLSETGYDNEATLNEQDTNFYALNTDQRIYTPNNDTSGNNNSGKSGKFDDSIYEKYLNSRTADDDALKKQVRR